MKENGRGDAANSSLLHNTLTTALKPLRSQTAQHAYPLALRECVAVQLQMCIRQREISTCNYTEATREL